MEGLGKDPDPPKLIVWDHAVAWQRYVKMGLNA